MYCIDSSILASIVTEEVGHEKLYRYLEDGVSIDLAFKETLNVVWKKIKLFGEELNYEKALIKILKLRKILDIYDQEILYDLALRISINYDITIYDSLFIALSLREGFILVTKDKKQKEIAEKLGIETILE